MAKRKKRTYDYAFVDDEIAYLNREIAKQFSALKAMTALDEINIKTEVGKAYRSLAVLIRKVLLLVARYYYTEAWEQERRYRNWLDEQWIEDILTGYDPVSKYVFVNEEDRKRARLVEALIASKTPAKELDAASKSLALMFRVYVVRVADEAVLRSMRDQDTEYVQWIAELDERTCEICSARDLRIYPIELLPDKPHINCRCTYRTVKKDYAKIEYTPAGDRGRDTEDR